MKKVVFCFFASVLLNAQSIDISKFYYRDYLDFGQGYGAFNGENSGKANTSNGTTLTGKDGTQVSVPNVPNFSASSRNGSLTAVGRGFAVTANHVVNFTPDYDKLGTYRTFGLTNYTIAKEDAGESIIYSVSKPYGRDEKFTRFDKYVVEGQVDMLDFENSIESENPTQESTNLDAFNKKLNALKNEKGELYLYQAGSGTIILRDGYTTLDDSINRNENSETKGGGFGTLVKDSATYESLVLPNKFCSSETQNCSVRGIMFKYASNLEFNNRITSGDSGSGIYAYDTKKKEWVLLGVVSQSTSSNVANIAAVSNKDLQDYQSKFEQEINLKIQDPAVANTWTLNGNNLKFKPRGDTPKDSHTLQNNKDIIFKGGGTIEVQSGIYRNNSGYAGGFVFTADNSATSANPTRYIFTNKDNKANIFAGSGLDIGQNVVVEWALRNKSNDSLHKIGKGELIVKTNYTPDTNKNENLGTLKIGEGKVTLDTDKKAFENIYITSGRGELALVKDKAQALGATKNANSASSTTSATSYTLAQENTNNMGFYFGKGGGKFDLAGNSLVLNTIAANDSKAIITNSSTGQAVNLEIEGLGYDTDGTKTTNKADTIIHASIGDNTNGANGTPANLNLIYKGNKTPTTRHSERSEESTRSNLVDSSATLSPRNDSTASGTTQTTKALQGSGASLIFDGHINIQGALNATNANIVLQGHPTTHATISDEKIREQITKAESGTSQKMPDYMDLSKPSTLNQPDWDNRTFKFGQGITLTNSALTLGRNATLEAKINATNSSILFGANAKHFIDNKDGANINGSGFGYYQLVESGVLIGEALKGANESIHYKGTITATGGTIESHILNFNASLDLKGGAKLTADYLTLTNTDSVSLDSTSSATTKTLKLQSVSDSNLANIFKNGSSEKLKVTESLWFDNSNLDLSKLSSTAGLTLPTEYNLYAFNGSTITTANFTNSKENAQFIVQNSSFTATNVSFTQNAFMTLDKGTLTLKNDLQSANLNLNLSNSSTLNAKTLTSNGASTINLNDKAELTLTNTFTSENLTLTLENESKFKANTLTASGIVKLQGDKNATLALETLNLDGVSTANLNGVTSTINTLNLTQTSQANIGENVSITTLKLTDSTANLQDLNTKLPQSIDLQSNSNLHFNELNLNDFSTKGLNLTSDTTSQAHIRKLIYDTTKAQTNGANKTPQSNLSVSELFKLDNVGKNLGTTQGTEQEKLNKDLLALEFGKTLTLQSSATLQVSFADIVKKDNAELKIGEYYKVFTATSLISNGVNMSLNFERDTGLFVEGKFEQNSFLVKFLTDNPKTFVNLHSRVNPQYLSLLDILLQHNQNDESINKTLMGDEKALNTRLAQIDTSLKTIANADSAALKTLPLLQKQEINARIQQNRFTTAKFALAKITNLAQKSDIVPTLLYLDENERQNRVWSGASASFFSNDSDKFSLQSVSIGYDRKLFGDEFLLGILASLTNTQLSSDETSLNPKIYTLALYSDALFRHGELQNELSFSLLNGDKGFESESGSYKSFYGFFESVYKVQAAFLPQSIKPIVLGRVNLRHFDEFSTATYKQKADDDISVDLGVGVEWLWQKESGFYSASFVAERDIYHSQKERLMSLTGAQKFVAYETNEPSFAYQLYLAGLENFKNGIYLRYGLSGFVDSKAYKGFKADVQVGYKF